MGLNTYPSNPFPPSTDRMDADALETEVSKLNSDVSELKSGLTNYQTQNDLNLEVPQRKNVLPAFIFKDRNTTGTWSGNTYTLNNVSFECQVNSDGYITSIKVNGTASASTNFFISNWDLVSSDFNNHILTGCPSNGGSDKYMIVFALTNSPYTAFYDYGSGVTISGYDSAAGARCYISVANGVALNNEMFYPMIRPATITDSTFAPYIPSVESRIEAAESGLTNVKVKKVYFTGTSSSNGNISITDYVSVNLYLVVGASVRDKDNTGHCLAAIPYMYTQYNYGKICGLHLIDEAGGSVANLNVEGYLFYTEYPAD